MLSLANARTFAESTFRGNSAVISMSLTNAASIASNRRYLLWSSAQRLFCIYKVLLATPEATAAGLSLRALCHVRMSRPSGCLVYSTEDIRPLHP